MSVDLISGHGDMCLNWPSWHRCFEVAVAFGWQPAGTVPPADYHGEWNGTYFTNDFQEVTDDDARAFGAALRRAVTALRTEQKLTKEQTKACDGINVDMVCEFADYAEKGAFAIL